MKILSLITHPHVLSNPEDLRSSSEHNLRYFWWNPRALWPSKGPTTIKTPKHSKDIGKTVHVTSVVQPSFYEATRIIFVHKENKNNDFI